MAFYELLKKVVGLLEVERRISFRALNREFDLDEDMFSDIIHELTVVKKVAQVSGDDILELVQATESDEDKKRATGVIENKSTASVEKTQEPIDEAIQKVVPPEKRKMVNKRNILVWIGVALVLIGVLLPWVYVSITMAETRRFTTSVNGLELSQGLLSVVGGIVGAIGGLISKKYLTSAWLSILVLIAGVVVIGFTLDVLSGLSRSDLDLGRMQNVMHVRQVPKLGVYMAFVGGVCLFIGSFFFMFKKKHFDPIQ